MRFFNRIKYNTPRNIFTHQLLIADILILTRLGNRVSYIASDWEGGALGRHNGLYYLACL